MRPRRHKNWLEGRRNWRSLTLVGRIWVFAWSVHEKKWGLRVGNKWFPVDRVHVHIPLWGQFGPQNPRVRLVGEGKCTLTRNMDVVTAVLQPNMEP